MSEQASGPGPITRDGSPVEMYLLLPPGNERDIIHSAVRPGGSILELGCGVGRITRMLVKRGHPVVAVDESPAMLSHVRDAETVLSDIETLDLGRTFDAVVLASHLVNTADPDQRSAFLQTCRRHVAPNGSVIIQRSPPVRSAEGSTEAWLGPVRIRVRDVELEGPFLSAVAEYAANGKTWLQPFTAELLDDDALGASLGQQGLEIRRWLNEERTWLEVVLTTTRSDRR
jgi:SAM-dependent methyltransferase